MWVLPSRGRPHNLERLVKAWRETGSTTCVTLALDWDDSSAYSRITLPDNWRLNVFKRMSLGDLHNAVLKIYPDEPWYGLLADDVVPVTTGWDTQLVEAAGRTGVAHCADGLNDAKQFTHGVIGGDLVREMGFLILPGLHRTYGDNVWDTIGRRRGVLKYLPEARLEHWHFANGKAKYDETYIKENTQGDKQIFEAWVAGFSG